jgi:hypothetical protein
MQLVGHIVRLLGMPAIMLVCLVAYAETPDTKESSMYLGANQPIEVRVTDLLGRLTLEEKVSLLHCDSK